MKFDNINELHTDDEIMFKFFCFFLLYVIINRRIILNFAVQMKILLCIYV